MAVNVILLSLFACNGDGAQKDKGQGPTNTTPGTSFTDGQSYSPGDPVLPRDCDAGDAAWVARAMPLMWGRKPHGAAEIELWAQMASTHGREVVVRAMSLDPEYYINWFDWMTDALYVARTGDKEYGDCFAQFGAPQHDGSLAAFLESNSPATDFGPSFTMADVLYDALIADNLSVVYRAHLFARMNRPTTGANVSAEELEYSRRVNFGELFYRTYLNRNLNCMVCHNSEFSTTDAPLPEDDHTWQIPGHFETAILGSPTGRPTFDEAYAMFRYSGVVAGFGPGNTPWGMSTECGKFIGEGDLPRDDMLGQDDAYFIDPYGPEGSIYDVERYLADGVDALRGEGLQVAGDGTVGGPDAFAYLLAASVASQVWATATGYDLVVAHHFPRNEGQMVRLQAFADALSGSGFSLRELLVAVTTDPYFNPGLPSTCEAMPYGLDPIFDPWTISDEDPYTRRNGASDAVHRLPARALLRSAHANLSWEPRDGWFGGFFGGGEEEAFQSAVGVFLRESDPGHRGTDFQGLLAFETELGTCSEPADGGDFIDDVLSDALESASTVGEVALAIKDRLTSAGISPQEQVLVEDLLQRSFSDPVQADAELESRLRLFCGTLLLSPQFQLVTDPEVGIRPALARDEIADCQRVAERMTAAGVAVTCEGSALQ